MIAAKYLKYAFQKFPNGIKSLTTVTILKEQNISKLYVLSIRKKRCNIAVFIVAELKRMKGKNGRDRLYYRIRAWNANKVCDSCGDYCLDSVSDSKG